VGKQHDLIVHYKSGIFEHFAVGRSWMTFEPPTIVGVAPAQVVAGQTVNITITGTNFGNNASDVSGHLEGASVLPCTPLTLLGDAQAICTLVPKEGAILDGNIILTVGNEWSGGAQSSKTGDASRIVELPAPVEVAATLPLDITDYPVGSSKAEELKATFATDVSTAIGVPSWRISVTGLKAGSIVITFAILPDETSTTAASPASLAVNIATQAADPSSPLRQGKLTSQASVSVPASVLKVAEAEAVAATAASGAEVPGYLKNCIAKRYDDLIEMERCTGCCERTCEIGPDIPLVNGKHVSPGKRHAKCRSICMEHCGWARPFAPNVR
jgi:hypothetical protein